MRATKLIPRGKKIDLEKLSLNRKFYANDKIVNYSF